MCCSMLRHSQKRHSFFVAVTRIASKVDGVNATLSGILPPGPESVLEAQRQLSDRVICNDAIAKLRLVSQHQRRTGQPFFLAVGFRKPHLAFRFPRPWLQFLQKQVVTSPPRSWFHSVQCIQCNAFYSVSLIAHDIAFLGGCSCGRVPCPER